MLGTAAVLVGTIAVTVLYWPILGIPLHADDFYNFSFWAEIRALPTASWWVNLDPVVLFQGGGWARGRAAPTGYAVFYLWQETSFRSAELLGVSPDLIQRTWRLIFPVLGVASLAAFLVAWRLIPRGAGRGPRIAEAQSLHAMRGGSFSRAFLAVALVLAATTQVHLLWSNEPLTAFNLAGWVTPILMLLFLATASPALRDGSSRRWLWTLLAIGIGLFGAWFYELFLLAPVLLLLLVVVATCLSLARRRWRDSLTTAMTGAVLGLGPFVAFALVRLGAGQGASGGGAYEGTSMTLGSRFFDTWRAASLSSLPTAGWDQTRRAIGAFWGSQHLRLSGVLAIIFLFTVGLMLLRVLSRVEPPPRLSSEAVSSGRGRLGPWGPLGGVFLLTGVWIGSAGIHSMTAKYQDELGATVGKVYLFYAPGLLAVSGFLAIGLLFLVSTKSRLPLYSAIAVLGIFATQQFGANSELARVGSATYAGEQAVIRAFEDARRTGAADRSRCAGLEKWRATGRWLKADEERHFQDAFRLTYGFPMCSKDKP